MKTYIGTFGSPPTVTVSNPKLRETYPLAPRFDLAPSNTSEFAWGDAKSAGAFRLALALMSDVLGDDEKAMRFANRFKWRVLNELSPKLPWELTEERIRAVLTDIQGVEKETSNYRAAVDREPSPVAMEGGAGIVWDSGG